MKVTGWPACQQVEWSCCKSRGASLKRHSVELKVHLSKEKKGEEGYCEGGQVNLSPVHRPKVTLEK